MQANDARNGPVGGDHRPPTLDLRPGCYADLPDDLPAIVVGGGAFPASVPLLAPTPNMATPVQYKKPRRINIVSVTLVLLLLVGGYAAYQYLPLYFMRHEAHRVLQETGSTLAGRAGYYMQDDDAREDLRKAMERNLKSIGIVDPDMETWIKIEGKEVRLGVFYSAWTDWPFGIIPRQETEYEVEHELVLN